MTCPDLVLREYQRRGVEIFRTLPSPARFFFAWDMGAGKTIGAIAVAKEYRRDKCLIVCPAIVREVWARELKKHWPERSVGIVTCGRNRESLSRKRQAERDAAFAADVQIVSYDLVGSIDAFGWELIIIDEFHNLRSPTSKQSNNIRSLFEENPDAWGLGLSGTPIPNEAQQLWNPVDIFFPGLWGEDPKASRVPYPFLRRFCHEEINEYGTRFYGLREEKRSELAEKFGKISQRVVQADFAQFLPPLFVEALPVENTRKLLPIVKDWIASLGEAETRIGIYTHLRQTALDLHSALTKLPQTWSLFHIDGSVTAETRAQHLEAAARAERSIIVGTTHALNEGVSLSFQKAALIVEWVTEVSQVTQFIGRFARQDSKNQIPTRVHFVVGPDDVSRAQVLSERIEAIQSVVKKSRADIAAAGVFQTREMSDEQFADELNRMVTLQAKRSNLWAADEDNDDDE